MSKSSECVGSYYVSGYTRDNGVEVSGYTRRCGAQHAGSSTKKTTNPTGKISYREKIIQDELERNEKMQRRADILYGTDEEYFKKYYGSNKESDVLKRFEDIELDNLKQKVQEKAVEVAPKVSQNAVFSDEEIVRAREFIQEREDLELRGYKDVAGVMTIGYGHTGLVDGKPITKDMVITKEKAEELYRKDFEKHIIPLRKVEVPLTKNQKIALASFIYNIGGTKFKDSDLLKKLNAGDYKGAADEFDIWTKAYNPKTGKKEPNNGLINRRKREKELFLTPDGE